jgi:subtilisin-like proprotein convertase family protein
MFRSELESGRALSLAPSSARLSRSVSTTLAAVIILIMLSASIYATVFPGTNTGAIADGGSPTPSCGAARDINFAVSGIATSIGAVSVDFTMNPVHTWVGDLQVSLIAPDATTHLLFSRIGANTGNDVGDNANMFGTYTFNDSATNNIWTVAASTTNANFVITTGAYRTQPAGPFGNDSPGPAFTTMNSVFATVPAGSRNGTWKLRFQDCSVGDTGTVSAANLNILSVSAAGTTVGGQVLTANGAGIRNAVVTIMGGGLSQPLYAITSAFGYYRFDDIEVGQTYIITINSKRYVFAVPVIAVSPTDQLSGVNFIAEPLD